MKGLALVADDYGRSASIDAAILSLAMRGRLSAVSCMPWGPRWNEAGLALRHAPVAAGLHLNLTEGEPLSPSLRRLWPQFPGLGRLWLMATTGRLPLDALRDEAQAQADAFERGLQRPPQHLDGHQHVHLLPGVEQAVQSLRSRFPDLPQRRIDRVLGPGWPLKRWLVHCVGRPPTAGCAAAPWQNEALLGVYDFRHPDYGRLFRRWLVAAPSHGALLCCHPGLDAHGDAIAPARSREYDYLVGAGFDRDLLAAGVTLVRLPMRGAGIEARRSA